MGQGSLLIDSAVVCNIYGTLTEVEGLVQLNSF
jgi:hypothetical protein